MKISEKWLREWVNPPLSTAELVARLTMAGLEVDSVTPVAGIFSGVVVGEILSIAEHPAADKLRVCQVAGHPDGVLQVVCGAANARKGLKIPFALVGASLPPKEKNDTSPVVIKAASLRGVESGGMLCSAKELGMESVADGLLELPVDAPVGKDIRDYLALDDNIIEVDLTPNRGDCLSVRGLAREVSVLTGMVMQSHLIPAVAPLIPDVFPVELEAGAGCPRYVGRIIRHINATRTSPLWLQERLRRSGIRSISPVVDVTNYVLLELGQPLHAFDFNKLAGKVKVKQSSASEQLTLLDGKDITLDRDTLLISDDTGPLAMAGIMGGSSSAVTDQTRDIFLEAAFFDPLALAGKARHYGLHTDSSHRFERGVDFSLQEQAIERATALLVDIVGGQAGPIILKEMPASLPKLPDISLRLQRVDKYLGLKLSADEIKQLLVKLGLELVDSNAGQLVFRPPGWRFDLRLEVDLLEEIARIYGYNNLPVRSFKSDLLLKSAPESLLALDVIKSRLVSLGYREVLTYSFVDPVLQNKLKIDADRSTIEVKNPISAEMSVMRSSLLPGLLSTALHNLNRQQSRMHIFEAGLVFSPGSEKTFQQEVLGLLVCGSREAENWFRKESQDVDFYDIKGHVEALVELAGVDRKISFQRANSNCTWLHPGQAAELCFDGHVVGWFGALHPGIQKDLGFNCPIYVAQLSLESFKTTAIPVFEELSRYPEVRRDLAFLVLREIPVQQLLDRVRMTADSYLTNLKVFDVYSGEGIDPQRKSVGLGLTFRDKSRTLTDSEINENVDRVVSALKTHFQAELRS